MARVHPQLHATPTTSSEQQVFTLWMKSLIFSSNGCVVFDSDGEIVYRVDNYDKKCSNHVYVMDASGSVLFRIVKKKFSVFGQWEGYRSSPTGSPMEGREKPGFRVRKAFGIRQILGYFRGYSFYKVVTDEQDKTQLASEYLMKSEIRKSSCKIIDNLGGPVAEVKRKRASGGVVLGEDVMTMVVEPHVDHSLVTGLVVVLGLIHQKL